MTRSPLLRWGPATAVLGLLTPAFVSIASTASATNTVNASGSHRQPRPRSSQAHPTLFPPQPPTAVESAHHSARLGGGSVAVAPCETPPLPQLLVPTSPLSAATPFGGAYTGFDRFPAFYFGAAEGGKPQSPTELDFVQRHALSGWGWQQGCVPNAHNGEAMGAAAAEALANHTATTPVGQKPDFLFVYRQSESIFTYYTLMEAVETNSTLKAAAELHDPVNRTAVCGGGGLMAFDTPEYVDYWSETVAMEVASEPHVNAVFFDGYDKLYAGTALAAAGCPGFTANLTAAALRDKVAATVRFVRTLNKHNTTAILSSYNYIAAATQFLTLTREGSFKRHDRSGAVAPHVQSGNMNGVFEDEYVTALNGTSWMRFYEVWLGHGPDQDAAQITNAILETSMGVPFIARSDPRLTKDLEYPACAFLVAQGPYCYFGVSTGWFDSDWAWHGEYSWRVGAPKGPPVRTSAFTWTRTMANATLYLDAKAGRCSVTPL